MKASFRKYTLRFKFNAYTSRGVLKTRDIFILKLKNKATDALYGLGEAAPLKGLSPDARLDFEEQLNILCKKLVKIDTTEGFDDLNLLDGLVSDDFPSLKFALETAIIDLKSGGKKSLFPSEFSRGETSLPINGLIWTGGREYMKKQLDDLIQRGFTCIKLKVGADFEKECRFLDELRDDYSEDKIELRLDANGAFDEKNVWEKLEKLAEYNPESIEQPIRPKDFDLMKELCVFSPVDIALDEELIGVYDKKAKQELIGLLKPKCIVLKPTLLGGLRHTQEWIGLAESESINWRITSALESNIGLNAIAQFTAKFNVNSAQGLGTGSLYKNNISSPLRVINGGLLQSDPCGRWGDQSDFSS